MHSPLLFSLEATQEHITLPSHAHSTFFAAVQQELARLESQATPVQIHAVQEQVLLTETPVSGSCLPNGLTLESHAPEDIPLPLAFLPTMTETLQEARPEPQHEALPEVHQSPPCPPSPLLQESIPLLTPQCEAPCPTQPPLEDSGALLLAHSLLAV